MYENILEILDLDYKPDLVLLGIGTILLIGVSTCAFYSYSQLTSQNPKQNIESPINQKGLENKLTPPTPKKNKENIFYNGYTQFV